MGSIHAHPKDGKTNFAEWVGVGVAEGDPFVRNSGESGFMLRLEHSKVSGPKVPRTAARPEVGPYQLRARGP